MTHLEVRATPKDGPQTSFPEFMDLKPAALDFVGAEIIEGATKDKRTGVALYFNNPLTGEVYVSYTTGRILANGLASAIKGSMERFGDDPNKP